MEGIGVLIAVAIIVAFVRFVIEAIIQGTRKISAPTSAKDPSAEGNIKISLVNSPARVADSDITLPSFRIEASGVIIVTSPKKLVRFSVRLVDVTDSKNHTPIFCRIPQFADHNGYFLFERLVQVPDAVCGFRDLPLGNIPVFALVGPRSGYRRIKVLILATDSENPNDPFGIGVVEKSMKLTETGFEEMKQKTAEHEQSIATLAVALAAADGQIDECETSIVRRFFAERNAEITDEDERHKQVDKLFEKAIKPFKDPQWDSVKEFAMSLCEQLASDSNESVRQSAYELAVEVVAADNYVDEKEHELLQLVAQKLKLPSDFVKEIHDRNLRAHMYNEEGAEQLLGMPPGLSDEEKREFLSKEYRKWRGRVTHEDSQVAMEASVRLQQIAKARAALDDE